MKTLCTTPMTTAAATATLKDRKPAITAAARPNARVSGPRREILAALEVSPAKRMTDRVESTAAIDQTIVETCLGEIDESRASAGFVAAALTVLPMAVWSRNTIRAITAIGARIRMPRSAPRTLTDPIVQVLDPKVAGKWTLVSAGWGILKAITSASPLMPIVETSTTTRGE